MNYSNPIETKDFRRGLRKQGTTCEHILWHYIRGRQVEGLKFRRQHGYGPYVMDFYCPLLKWCIEVDGNIHDTAECKEKDDDRTAFLNHHGIVVTRIRNEEIETDVATVVTRLRHEAHALAEKKSITLPLKQEGETI